ncbi:FecR family protein [Pedobacter sp.]|jgi:transmembrane sensor|uniref:FecR family protein n=1 Tax=Pedobacter sp. TaxID=1411316 RepID=UPI002C5CE704|nr:FecR domain-containing protein [Pedobacter sp.]HWW40829.1 FecR domain-containing protein [Pedobacter sp.]
MKSDKMSIADLLADESFINYCKRSSPEDIAQWESYMRDNPGRQELVESARARFIELFNAMAMVNLDEQENLLMNRVNIVEPALVVKMEGSGEQEPKNVVSPLLKWMIPAAAVAIGFFFIINYLNRGKKEVPKIFAAAYGERKNIQLPDGSIVTLNAGSKIHIDENYGVSARDIYLEGEAFFDVKQSKDLPFIVHTSAMDVKALGTAFDVKAYPDEKIIEASLVSGLVEVTLKEEKNYKIVLHPNQKVQWKLPGEGTVPTGKSKIPVNNPVEDVTKTEEGEVKETAWIQNKLVFTDESFEDIAILLERWYGIKVEFADDAVRNYRFTGIFEKEKLSTVLLFLKESKSFNYEIKSEETLKVVISK